MKKYTFLVHHADYVDFLTELRNQEVFHVKHREGEPSEELLQKLQIQKGIRSTLNALKTRIVAEEVQVTLKETDGLALVDSFMTLTREQEVLQEEQKALLKEIDFQKPWGDFNPEMLTPLEALGLTVRFFICPIKKFRIEWGLQYPLQIIQDLAPDRYFVVITAVGEELLLDAEEIPPPATALSDLQEKEQALERKIKAINQKLDAYAMQGLEAIEAALRQAEENTQLVTVIDSTHKEVEDAVMVLEGFVPTNREAQIASLCERKGLLFLAERPRPEDQPPVLLKNSAFSRLFEPIGRLFSLPAYQELDLTPFFAPFFMMFFGFCLGDAGYGAVVLLGASVYKLRAAPKWKPTLTLAQFLGIATIIFGVLTGTVFGMNLLDDQFAALGSIRRFMLNSDQTFQLALILGLVQILFGLVLQAFNRARQFGWKYAIVTGGWIILLLSIIDLALLKKTGGVSTISAWSGVGLILLFNDPQAGFLSRLGKGIWELYGITGFFGDLLSYIRLFALGISSAILGFVVNDISLQIKDGIPYLGPVLFVLFLVVGHSANLLISALGSFVHPMRLTFVEFYKNAGFSGGGKPYRPFVRTEEK